MKERQKQIKQLKKENERIRSAIDKIIGLNYPLYSPLWVAINDLIENEIQQEVLCDEPGSK